MKFDIDSYYEDDDTTIEWCPYCNNEVLVYSKYITKCLCCGKPVLPCSTCPRTISEEMGFDPIDCATNCPFEGRKIKEIHD